MGGVWRRIGADRRGGAALVAGLVLPAIALGGAAALELALVAMDRSALQDAADTAALYGAKALGVAGDTGVAERARQFALLQAGRTGEHAQLIAAAQVVGDDEGVTVTLSGSRSSFFSGLLSKETFDVQVQATAMRAGTTPLCILAHGVEDTALELQDRAQIEARDCMVQSNADLDAADRSRLTASLVQAVGSARGSISPDPQVGAELIVDPFLDRDLSPREKCGKRTLRVYEGEESVRLSPGVHCDDIVLRGRARLTLEAGEHWFLETRLSLSGQARLEGDDVVLLFDHAAFEFMEKSRVRLSGRKSGRLAGFLIVGIMPEDDFTCGLAGDVEEFTDRGLIGGAKSTLLDVAELDDDVEGRSVAAECRRFLGSRFVIASDNVQSLQGVVYVPASKLVVTGNGTVAEQSDWTVMVAKSITIEGSPTLVINADYAASDIPVPPGVGPVDPDIRLAR